MARIVVTSTLTTAARRALKAQSDYLALHENFQRPEVAALARAKGFTQRSRYVWVPMFDTADVHTVARFMMTVAGTTFAYTVEAGP